MNPRRWARTAGSSNPAWLTDVHLGTAPGAPNPSAKAMTVVASLLAGGDCIDDADALRKGNAEVVLGGAVMALSTIGTFLRSFSSGHARQLDAVLEDLLPRAWDAGATPDLEKITVDLDSSVLETYGLQKQGAQKFAYTHVRGYTRCSPCSPTRARSRGQLVAGVVVVQVEGGPARDLTKCARPNEVIPAITKMATMTRVDTARDGLSHWRINRLAVPMELVAAIGRRRRFQDSRGEPSVRYASKAAGIVGVTATTIAKGANSLPVKNTHHNAASVATSSIAMAYQCQVFDCAPRLFMEDRFGGAARLR